MTIANEELPKSLDEIAEEWVEEGEWGMPDPDDKAGIWMKEKLKQAFCAGAMTQKLIDWSKSTGIKIIIS